MIDVGIAGNEHDVDGVPAAGVHFGGVIGSGGVDRWMQRGCGRQHGQLGQRSLAEDRQQASRVRIGVQAMTLRSILLLCRRPWLCLTSRR